MAVFEFTLLYKEIVTYKAWYEVEAENREEAEGLLKDNPDGYRMYYQEEYESDFQEYLWDDFECLTPEEPLPVLNIDMLEGYTEPEEFD